MPNQPLVYFFAKSNFGDTQPDFIKIGYTTDLSGRQANLQTGSESRIWEIGVIPFEMEDEARGEERRLHEWFGGFRAYGEWFYATPRIIKYIRNYAVQHTELLTAEMPSETEDSSEVSFGEQLRERRNDANITQEELATKVGCTRGYISFLENKEAHRGRVYIRNWSSHSVNFPKPSLKQDRSSYSVNFWRPLLKQDLTIF